MTSADGQRTNIVLTVVVYLGLFLGFFLQFGLAQAESSTRNDSLTETGPDSGQPNAPQPGIHNLRICAPDGVALDGYDVVSYRQGLAPLHGSDEFTTIYNELTYRFVNAANRDIFIADPKRYLPTYLGWCSTNLAMGRLACPDYTNFKIENGYLLLSEHVGFTNGRDVWNSDPAHHKRLAVGNFDLLSRPAEQ